MVSGGLIIGTFSPGFITVTVFTGTTIFCIGANVLVTESTFLDILIGADITLFVNLTLKLYISFSRTKITNNNGPCENEIRIGGRAFDWPSGNDGPIRNFET